MKWRASLAPALLAMVFIGLFLFRSGSINDSRLASTDTNTEWNSEGQTSWNEEDWSTLKAKVLWGLGEGLDTLAIGAAMGKMGRSFVGTTYVPGTLEVAGPERLVINFRGLDCVAFVENVFAISRFMRVPGAEGLLQDRKAAEEAYESMLREHRYRNGEVNGYASRLHYFSDWIGDNHRRGLLHNISGDLQGIVDHDAVNFLSRHPEAYPQLADSVNILLIRTTEERLSAAGRIYIPEDRINLVAQEIQDGDIIAATSTVPGLDVAHTGLALWIDETLHLLHAPLVGEAVQISEVSLAERISRIGGQDGIIVSRPEEQPQHRTSLER